MWDVPGHDDARGNQAIGPDRDTLNDEINRLLKLQDELLDRLVVEGPPNR